MQLTEFLVNRGNFSDTRIAHLPVPNVHAGEILVAIDRFALTANNITYAVVGDSIGYWKFFPSTPGWGIVPVWGFATVVESQCGAIAVGEQIWGFLPMASHLVLTPDAVNLGGFVDSTAHRRDLPEVYNRYQRTAGESDAVRQLGDTRSLLFPLFITSFVIFDFLADNAFFGAKQVLIGSASSKTAFGLANFLRNDAAGKVSVAGLTSPKNADFVRALGTYDQVSTYDRITALDPSIPTAFVDMSGDASVIETVHQHFAKNLVLSSMVGITHWQQQRPPADLPGATPTMFFAPSQIVKREQDWGAGEIMRKAYAGSARVAAESAKFLNMRYVHGAAAVQDAFSRAVDGQAQPSEGLILSLTEKES